MQLPRVHLRVRVSPIRIRVVGRQLAGLVIATLLALAGPACTDERPGQAAPKPWMLDTEFTESFHTGDESHERQFARITSMAFAPNGHLVVVDRDNFAVSVLDRSGTEITRWGAEGQGPSEFEARPVSVAVSDAGMVAIRSFQRIDMFTLDGEPVRSHVADVAMLDLAFDAQGGVVARTRPVRGLEAVMGEEGVREQVMRVPDGDVLWTAPRPGPPPGSFQLGAVHALLADLGQGRIVVGVNDEYDLTVLDASSGRKLGSATRDVTLRGPTEAFNDAIRAEGLATATTELDRSIANSMVYGDPFPVVVSTLGGPPGGAVWVRRGIGVGDDLAPPVGDGNWTLVLYDLFHGDSYEYIGTVELPQGLTLMAGDSERVAGVHTDDLGVHSVRVLRVDFLN